MRHVALLALCAVAGCGASADHFEMAARLRAVQSLGCPERQLVASYVGGGGVVVSGCGLAQSYTCVRSGYRSEATCAPDGAPRGTYMPPTSDGGGDAEVALAAIAPCHQPAGTPIHVAIGVDGDVLQLAGGDACVDRVLRSTMFATRSDATTLDVVVQGVAGPPQEIVPVAPAAPPPSAMAPGPTGSVAETHARAAIDGLRAVILACTSGAPIAVVGEWMADGTLSVRLPDAQIGTSVDGCVRAAATGARVEPAPGTAGSVLHPLH